MKYPISSCLFLILFYASISNAKAYDITQEIYVKVGPLTSMDYHLLAIESANERHGNEYRYWHDYLGIRQGHFVVRGQKMKIVNKEKHQFQFNCSKNTIGYLESYAGDEYSSAYDPEYQYYMPSGQCEKIVDEAIKGDVCIRLVRNYPIDSTGEVNGQRYLNLAMGIVDEANCE